MKHPFKKGRRFEKELSKLLSINQIPSKVLPVYLNDLRPNGADIVALGRLNIQCKHQESISNKLWLWLTNNDFLAIRKNHKPTLFVMRQEHFMDYLLRIKNG